MSDRQPAPHRPNLDPNPSTAPRRRIFAPKLGLTSEHLRILNALTGPAYDTAR